MRLKSRQKLLGTMRHIAPPASSAERNLSRAAIPAAPLKATLKSAPAKIALPGSAQFSGGTGRNRRDAR
jgi:hypothetical protein